MNYLENSHVNIIGVLENEGYIKQKTSLDEGVCLKINNYVKKHNLIPNDVFLSIVGILLQKYYYTSDVMFGEISEIGIQKNTDRKLLDCITSIEVKAEQESTFCSIINEVANINSKCKSSIDFNNIDDKISLVKMLVIEDSKLVNKFFVSLSQEKLKGLKEFEKILFFKKVGEKYICYVFYNKKKYKYIEINYFISHLNVLLKEGVQDFNQNINELSAVDEVEKAQIIYKLSRGNIKLSKEETIISLFESQVIRTPDHVAIVFESESLTYRQLNDKANMVRNQLLRNGVRLEEPVIILSKHCVEQIIGILGILKAGGAYVPISPDYPIERINYIIDDCNAKLILTTDERTFPENKITILNIINDVLRVSKAENSVVNISANNLAYIIYTSGTTGKPKGIMVEHAGVVNLCNNFIRRMYDRYEVDNVALFASCTFDASVQNIFTPLITGRSLFIINEDDKMSLEKILDYINTRNIDAIDITPSYMSMMLEMKKTIELKIVLVGGERLNIDSVKLCKEYQKFDIVNVYGPTEATVDATYYICTGEETDNIPIGKPIDNVGIQVLNKNKVCGIDMIGEVCITGIGLARGYVNREDLKEEKFITDINNEIRIYRTGDLAKWRCDGNLEYIGRLDQQVKIRGFRVELDEINHLIKEIEFIKDCVTTVYCDKTNTNSLITYIVSDRQMDIEVIKDKLCDFLPHYMVPSQIIQVQKIPLTSHGKIDLRALEDVKNVYVSNYVMARTKKEKILCDAYSEILGVERIGGLARFFELGGDSIKALRIVSRVRQYGYEISVRDIMGNDYLKNIAVRMTEQKKKSYYQGEVTGVVCNTPIIKNFIKMNYKYPNHFNQAKIVYIKKTDNEIIKNVLDKVVEHHDILRSVFRNNKLEVLKVKESKLYDYEEIILDSNTEVGELEEIFNRIQASINLEEGPMMKVAKIKLYEDNYLFICIHHLVIDGISWRILIEDITQGIHQQESGQMINFPEKTASFIEWSNALNNYREHQSVKNELPYWTNICNEMYDNQIKIYQDNNKKQEYKEIQINLDTEYTNYLLFKASNAFNTEINDLLLASLGIAMYKWNSGNKISIFLEGHGREKVNVDINIDRTIGWFTIMYPVIINCFNDIEKQIINTKEMLRHVPNHGIGYGLLGCNIEKGNYLLFNYMGEIDAEIREDKRLRLTVGRCSAKQNAHNCSIEIKGEIVGRKLYFYIMYDSSLYCEERMKEFSILFDDALKAIIDFCIQHKQQYTLSDVTDDLDLNDLEIINSLYEN